MGLSFFVMANSLTNMVGDYLFEQRIRTDSASVESLAVRILPLIVKRPIIDYINRRHGDRYCSQTFSNLGNISLPESMQP